MKTLRLVLGIISIVLAFFMLFTSCAGGIAGSLDEDNNLIDTSSYGVIIAFMILAGGITAICTRKNLIGSLITGIIYLAGYIVSIFDYTNGLGTGFGTVSVILAIIFIISVIIQAILKSKKNKEKIK